MNFEEGFRDDLGAVLHDMGDRGDSHQVVFDFATRDDSIDNYRTSWAPHVFRQSFSQRPHPPMLWNHNPDVVIGSALHCESLADRARVVNRFADFRKVPKAEEVHSLLRDGHIPGASFHYRNGRTEPHPRRRMARRFTSADFLESSPVTFPSSPDFRVAGIRSMASARLMADDLLDDLIRVAQRFNRRTDHRELAALLAERAGGIRSDDSAQDAYAALRGDFSGLIDRIDETLKKGHR